MKRPYLIMGLLTVLFLAPGIGAYVFFTHPQWIKTTHHGVLLQPPKVLSALHDRDKWQLMYWHPTRCEADCARRMNDLARVRLALGRHVRDIDTVLVLKETNPQISSALQAQLHTEDSRTLMIVSVDDQMILGHQAAVYIANPKHAIILKYACDQPLDDIFQDLKILVNQS